jgi:hypothetical protein
MWCCIAPIFYLVLFSKPKKIVDVYTEADGLGRRIMNHTNLYPLHAITATHNDYHS